MTPVLAARDLSIKSVMANKKIIKFRAENEDIFEAILSGKKKVETRAATERYREIKPGDTIILICGKRCAEKKVTKVEFFKSISAILKKYKPQAINPKISTAKEAKEMWESFSGYKEKIKKYGLMAMRLG